MCILDLQEQASTICSISFAIDYRMQVRCELCKVVFVQVPLFIAQGQKILIDTRSDSYLSKVK